MKKSPATNASSGGESGSPRRLNNTSQPDQDPRPDSTKPDTADPANVEPLAPPPRPGQQQQQGGNSLDYFSAPGSLSLEPNPFEQSFGGAPETPGGTKLPSVAALTSPSSLLPGSGATPFNWGPGSLRTGPLSPAMLSGPTNDYFGDTHHLRGGFPTPNESSLRTGLTPGGGASVFPATSPNSQAIFNQLAGGGATPGTLDFQRAALSAAAANREQTRAGQVQQAVTSQPQDIPAGVPPARVEPSKVPAAGPFDPHDNDAANGLFMLAQGGNGSQSQNRFAVPPHQQSQAHPAPAPGQQAHDTSQQMTNGNASMGGHSARGASEARSAMSEDMEQQPVRNTRSRGKRNSAAAAATAPTAAGSNTLGRRKADAPLSKSPANKKSKASGMPPPAEEADFDAASDDDNVDDGDENKPTTKRKLVTEDEKRKNFLERNRVAALKCRQRKKLWLANLQTKVDRYTSENQTLVAEVLSLREEVASLKLLLLEHKDCPVTQQHRLQRAPFMRQPMEPFNPQMNPYDMAAAVPSQPAASGQDIQPRYE